MSPRSQGYAAYGKSQNAVAAADPRATESRALRLAAQGIRSALAEPGMPGLWIALSKNIKLWTVLAEAAADPASPLPDTARKGIVQLAVWIADRSVACAAGQDASIAAHICSINAAIARGLDGIPATTEELAAAQAAVDAKTAVKPGA